MPQRIAFVIGLGSYLSIVSFMGWSDSFLCAALPLGQGFDAGTYSYTSSLFSTGTYLIAAFVGLRIPETRRVARGLFGGAVALMFGSFALVLVSAVQSAWVVAVLAAMAGGVGRALFFLVWLVLFARIPSQSPWNLVIAATALGAVLYFAILHISSDRALWLVALVLLPLSAVSCWLVMRQVGSWAAGALAREGNRQAREQSALSRLARPLVLILGAMGLVSLMWAMMRSYAHAPSVETDSLTVLGRLASSLLLFAAYRLVSDRVGVLALFSYCFPVLALGFIFMPLLNSTAFNVGVSACTYTVHSMISIAAMVLCRQLNEKSHVPVLGSVGMAWGVIGVANLVGREIGFVSREASLVVTLVFAAVYVVYQVVYVKFKISSDLELWRPRGRTAEKPAHPKLVPQGPSDEPTPARLSQVECFARRYGLTERERDVLEHLIKGRTSQQIAEKLFVSRNTVLTHSKSLYRKVGVHKKSELVDRYEEEGETAPPHAE